MNIILQMKYFLAKTEPHEYSIDDLAKDQIAEWDGVRNPQAITTIKSMDVGDLVLIYHSGENPSIVGLAEIAKRAFPDPNDSRSFIPTFKYIRKFEKPVTLLEIKNCGEFDDLALVRQGRLSTMLVTEKFVNWLTKKGLNLKN